MNLCTFWTFSTKRRKAGPIGPIRSTSPQRAMAGWRPPTRKQDDLHCDDTASQQLCWSVPQFVWERKRLIQVFAIHTALPFTHCNAFLCLTLAAKARREIQTLLHRTLRGSGPRMETSASGLFSSDLICQILLVLAAQWTTGPCVVFSSVSTKGDRRSCFRRHANPGPKILICCSQLNRRQPCRGFLRVCAFLMNTHQLD